MMADFNSISNPTAEDLIHQYEMLINLHRESVGKCSTCVNHIPTPPDLPGFVTDYGECELKKDIFYDKVCGLTDAECDGYKEDTSFVEDCLAEIEKLK